MDDCGNRPTIVPAHHFAPLEAKFELANRASRSEQGDEVDIAVNDYLTTPVFSPRLTPRLMRFGCRFMRRPASAAAPS
jgi:hypothetical protein